MKKVSLLFAAFLSLSALTGCESAEDRAIAAGQHCLDSATDEARATQCIREVEGYESSAAYLIRCSANFVAQGFTTQRFIDAFQAMEDGSGSSADQTSLLFSYFVFPNSSPLHSAETTYLNCQKSGLKSIIQLASTVRMATVLAKGIGGGTIPANLNPNDPNFDPQDFVDSVQNLDPNTVDKEALGAAAKVATENYCSPGSTYEKESICESLNEAVASSTDLASLGEELIRVLQNM